MTFPVLALICVAALLGPLLGAPGESGASRWSSVSCSRGSSLAARAESGGSGRTHVHIPGGHGFCPHHVCGGHPRPGPGQENPFRLGQRRPASGGGGSCGRGCGHWPGRCFWQRARTALRGVVGVLVRSPGAADCWLAEIVGPARSGHDGPGGHGGHPRHHGPATGTQPGHGRDAPPWFTGRIGECRRRIFPVAQGGAQTALRRRIHKVSEHRSLPWNSGSSWWCFLRWRGWRCGAMCPSCSPDSPSGWQFRPWANRAGWPTSSLPSPRGSWGRCFSCGLAHPWTCANLPPTRA